jgi:hypothetical protein
MQFHRAEGKTLEIFFTQKLLASRERRSAAGCRAGGKQEKGGREIEAAVLLNGEKSGCWHS